MVTLTRNLEAVLDQLERNVAEAFRRAITDIKSEVTIQSLERLIAQKDAAGVGAILGIDPAYFSQLDRAIDIAYYEGANSEGNIINEQLGTAATFRFDGRHRRAEHWVEEHGGNLVVQVTNEARENIRYFVRQGIEAGRHPREIALDLVGRQYNGRREGGIIGLTLHQTQYVWNAREELSDPAKMANWFNRNARDRRYDTMVRRAIESGKPLDQRTIDALVDKYADKLLVLRGETIARTEALAAYNAGRYEAAQQLVESGKVPRSAISFIWDATLSKRTRDSHLMLNGTEIPFGGLFTSPVTGGMLRYPGDTGMGAPGSETINCRCTMRTRIDRKQLATKRPRGRPVGSRNRPREPEPQARPPVAPPVPAPEPVAAPQGPSRAELEAVALAPGGAIALPRGGTPEYEREVLEIAADLVDRFGVRPFAQIRGPNPALRQEKGKSNANAWMYMFGPDAGQMVLMQKIFIESERDRLEEYYTSYAARNTDAHKQAVANHHTMPRAVKDVVARIDKWEWTFGSTRRAERDGAINYELIRRVVTHETGHHFHANNYREIEEIVSRIRLVYWAKAVSGYAMTSKEEYIAECFTIYAWGPPSEWDRIHPDLLRYFKSKDRRNVTS